VDYNFFILPAVSEPTSPSVDEGLNVEWWSDNFGPMLGDGMLGDDEPTQLEPEPIRSAHQNPQLVELPSQLPSPTVNFQQKKLIEARHFGNRPNQSLQAGRCAELSNHDEFVPHEVLALGRRPWKKEIFRLSEPDQKLLQKLRRKQQNKQNSASYRDRAKNISRSCRRVGSPPGAARARRRRAASPQPAPCVVGGLRRSPSIYT